MTPRQLEKTIRELLQQPLADTALREQLEKLAAAEISFSGFTWLFGPDLYQRNRILFRPFIHSRFSSYIVLPRFGTKQLSWFGKHERTLEAWFAEVDKNNDVELFRLLYEWRLDTHFEWGIKKNRSVAVRRDVLARFRTTQNAGERQVVLRKFDLWFDLDEDTACALYQIDPRAAAPFILRHLPTGVFSPDKRVLWNRLTALAENRGDDEFRWNLYRRQVALKQWAADALSLCDSVKDPSELVRQLDLRHPAWGNVANGFNQIVRRRGRDVFPYIMRHLRSVRAGWITRGDYGVLADFARENGWWDLWTGLLRVCSSHGEFNKQVRLLLEDTTTPETDVRRRLAALAGVSREWNWPGLGIATLHSLKPNVAIQFYDRFPDLLRGPFRLHVQPSAWGENHASLLERVLAAGDDLMIDFMASRLLTLQPLRGRAPKMLKQADTLAAYYEQLRSDETAFSRRAANVLSQVPAYSILQYNVLLRENRLARLLLERSAASYLADPASVADLVEAAEIHVMGLAYRALGLEDARAREQAPLHLPLLLGTLLRPMQRQTRILAFGALANAANSPANAHLILERARDALNLPDAHYPKEPLLGLIARILHRWPEFRGVREHPVVFERTAA